MKSQDKVYSSRFQRTGKFLKTGAKVGSNYLRHYSKRLVTGDDDRQELNERNADEIYNSLSNLKGSALKVAQMLSLDQGVLPEAYSRKFSQAQYSAPPLSYPLVVKTFQQYFGKSPLEVFDKFEKESFAAASIGQVHRAEKDGRQLAVKVQYPGVSNSIESDLRMVQPIVKSMFDINQAEMDHYLHEVKDRLLEETDYELELERGQKIMEACREIPRLVAPKYYPELSAPRVLTMDWLEGKHLNDYLATKPSQEERNKMGQTIWDFYDFQIHALLEVHADPHPGNFLFREDGSLGVIDFGCVKEFPQTFYDNYFLLMDPQVRGDKSRFEKSLRQLQFLLPSDTGSDAQHFIDVYGDVLELLGRPFFSEEFDFADQKYFDDVYGLSDVYQNDPRLRNAKAARGPRDAIYLNRTYFGLYSILHLLGAKVETRSRVRKLVPEAS